MMELYHGCHGNECIPSQCVKGVPGNRHGNRLIDGWDIFKVILESARLVFPAARVRNYGEQQGSQMWKTFDTTES